MHRIQATCGCRCIWAGMMTSGRLTIGWPGKPKLNGPGSSPTCSSMQASGIFTLIQALPIIRLQQHTRLGNGCCGSLTKASKTDVTAPRNWPSEFRVTAHPNIENSGLIGEWRAADCLAIQRNDGTLGRSGARGVGRLGEQCPVRGRLHEALDVDPRQLDAVLRLPELGRALDLRSQAIDFLLRPRQGIRTENDASPSTLTSRHQPVPSQRCLPSRARPESSHSRAQSPRAGSSAGPL